MSYSSEVLADSPWGFWQFTETSGTTLADSSGSGRTMDITGSPAFSQPGPGSLGAISFPTGANYAITSTTLTTSDVTLEAWVYLTAYPTIDTTIIGLTTAVSSNVADKDVFIRPTGQVRFQTFAGGSVTVITAASLSLNTWHHIACSVGAAGTFIRIDKVPDGSHPATTSYTGAAQKVTVRAPIDSGVTYGTGGNGGMIVAAPAIYTTQLSSTRTDAHYDAAGLGATVTGTIAGTSPAGVGAITGTVPTTGTLAGTSPSGVGSLVGDVPSFGVTGTIAGTSPSGVGSLVGDVITPPIDGTLAGTSPSGVGSLAGSVYVPEPDTLYLSAPSPIGAALTSFEVYVPAPEVLFLSAPSPIGAALRIHPVPVPVPGWISDHPLQAQRHLMTPKTEAQPRKMGDPLRARAAGSDGYVYPVEVSDVGRYRVFASGIDITYLAGTPTTLHEWSFAKFFGPLSASFTVPLPEWAEPGQGDYRLFWGDAPIEIALEDSEGNLRHLWEGFTGEESDTAAPGQTGVTWNCEGTFQQAAHWLCDPPAVRTERDAGHVIADLLNSVPNHRYNKIRRFTTGHLVSDGGDSAQSVLARVAEIIGETFDDDSNQLGLQRRGPYAYELDWNQPVTVPDWTFTKGSPGFTSTLTRPHNARRDMVFGRGIAPDGGFWMNRHFPGLASSTPPVYPMAGFANITVGTTDADTVGGKGVSTAQRRMRELGYPVKVDGVWNANDAPYLVQVQRQRGILDNGVFGPQSWAALWEGGTGTPETATIRLPLTFKANSFAHVYDASGAVVGKNPLFDGRRILHATPEVDFGTNIRKSNGRGLAGKIRVREASPGYVGTLTAEGVDPHEVGSSRLFVNDGANILVDGHHGGTVVQVSAVTHTPTTSRWTVDSGARGQALVDAIMDRQRDVRRSLAGKSTKVTDRGTLNASQLGQYESESPAGKYSRTAINGDSGLWTVRCIYVAEQGLARFRLTSSPNAEIVTLICGKRITANQVAAIAPDPLDSSASWYNAEKTLREKFGLVNVAGTPASPGGYYPRQKPGTGVENPGPLTGVQAAGNLSMKSQTGGFFWVAVFTSRSTFVEGEFEPEVSTA